MVFIIVGIDQLVKSALGGAMAPVVSGGIADKV
jgi:hypothetical protein